MLILNKSLETNEAFTLIPSEILFYEESWFKIFKVRVKKE